VPLSACSRTSLKPKPELTLYCSADAELAEPIIEAFTQRTGISVQSVFDTEATKTTGLVNRLIAEKDNPQADAWWSSEPFGTIRLARAGVLAPYRSKAADDEKNPWPISLREHNEGARNEPRWYAFGSRLRVIACNTKILSIDRRPVSLDDLTKPALAGRIGMARPAFGTTRGHMAFLLQSKGEAWFERWLAALNANGLRLFDGNAAICRALANGQIHAGLTDSDDVFSAQRQQWPVDFCPWFESSQRPMDVSPVALLPNTAAVIWSSRDPGPARAFVEELLSLRVQEAMARSDSRNIPVDESLAASLSAWAPAHARASSLDLEAVASKIESAMVICERVLGA
jgi:iron(III) transport system substrate-binding protein